MNMFVMADKNWGIYKNRRPLASIPAEEKSRMAEITGKVVVYDITYMDKLPGQQPVKNTVNLIYTPGQEMKIRGAQCFSTVEDLRFALSSYRDEDIYIISSEILYREFLQDTGVVHVAKIDYSYEADAFFENLDKNPDFKLVADSDEQYCFNIIYSFLKYERVRKAR